MIRRFLSSVLLISIPAFGGSAYSADQTPLGQESINGLPSEELLAEYGSPDSKQVNGIAETWHYGDSLVILTGGKVTGHLDNGELTQRKHFAGGPEPDDLLRNRGWKNDWTTTERRPREGAMDDIVGVIGNSASSKDQDIVDPILISP